MKSILTSYLGECVSCKQSKEESRKKQRDSNFNLQFPFVLPSVLLRPEGKNTTVEWRQHVLRPLGLKLYFPWETGPLWKTWPPCSYIQPAAVSVSPRKCHIDSTVTTRFLHSPARKGKNEKTPTDQSELLPSPPSGGSLHRCLLLPDFPLERPLAGCPPQGCAFPTTAQVILLLVQ